MKAVPQIAPLVGVDLHRDEAGAELFEQHGIAQHRVLHFLAGAAPRGMKVDEHRQVALSRFRFRALEIVSPAVRPRSAPNQQANAIRIIPLREPPRALRIANPSLTQVVQRQTSHPLLTKASPQVLVAVCEEEQPLDAPLSQKRAGDFEQNAADAGRRLKRLAKSAGRADFKRTPNAIQVACWRGARRPSACLAGGRSGGVGVRPFRESGHSARASVRTRSVQSNGRLKKATRRRWVNGEFRRTCQRTATSTFDPPSRTAAARLSGQTHHPHSSDLPPRKCRRPAIPSRTSVVQAEGWALE